MSNSQNLMVNLKACLSAESLKLITVTLKKLKEIKNPEANKPELKATFDQINEIFFGKQKTLEQKKSDKSYAEKKVCLS